MLFRCSIRSLYSEKDGVTACCTSPAWASLRLRKKLARLKVANARAIRPLIHFVVLTYEIFRLVQTNSDLERPRTISYLLLFQGFQQRGQLPENPFELSGICPLSCLHGGFAKVLVRFENHLSVCVVKNDSESPQHLGADDPCQVRGG